MCAGAPACLSLLSFERGKKDESSANSPCQPPPDALSSLRRRHRRRRCSLFENTYPCQPPVQPSQLLLRDALLESRRARRRPGRQKHHGVADPARRAGDDAGAGVGELFLEASAGRFLVGRRAGRGQHGDDAGEGQRRHSLFGSESAGRPAASFSPLRTVRFLWGKRNGKRLSKLSPSLFSIGSREKKMRVRRFFSSCILVFFSTHEEIKGSAFKRALCGASLHAPVRALPSISLYPC